MARPRLPLTPAVAGLIPCRSSARLAPAASALGRRALRCTPEMLPAGWSSLRVLVLEEIAHFASGQCAALH